MVVVVHAFDPSTWEVEAGLWEIQTMNKYISRFLLQTQFLSLCILGINNHLEIINHCCVIFKIVNFFEAGKMGVLKDCLRVENYFIVLPSIVPHLKKITIMSYYGIKDTNIK